MRVFPPRGPFVTALALAFIGLVLASGGVRLIGLGGSWYYALVGFALVVSAALLWTGSLWGVRVYWAALAGTLVWALWEAGLAPWSLMPRIAGPALIGIWLASPWPRARLGERARPSMRRQFVWLGAGGLAALAALIAIVAASLEPAPARAAATPREPATGWPAFGGERGGSRFSAATQIGPENVRALTSAWTFHTGEFGNTFEATPILVDDALVFCTARDVVFAIDAETGVERWRFDPAAETAHHLNLACRGVSVYRAPSASGPCATRILLATVDARLIALDARTGRACEGFGAHGVVSLMDGIGPAPPGFYYVTSPPVIVNDQAVTGAFVLDNQTVQAPSGVIRSFDARTGKLRWAWDMGRPDRRGAPEAGGVYTPGTPNAWSALNADARLGLVYVPMGNPAPDYWGGKRRPFDERFGSAIVALDANTGAPRWAFQTTHHDLWDYDVPAQPVLVDVVRRGVATPALVQATKRGDVFILDRRTGVPIFPVAEQPAPQGAAAGDVVAATQPVSSVSIAPRRLTEADMWGVSPIDQMFCRIWFRSVRYQGVFTPPSEKGTLVYPGATGVTDWGGVSVDEDRGLLIVNSSLIGSVDELTPRSRAPASARRIAPDPTYEWGPQEGTPFVLHSRNFEDPYLQIPCTAPPWGALNAIDLSTGRIRWSRPFGTARDSGPFRRASHLPLPMGVPNLGGPITTRSGLVFIGASVDRYLRAFDVRSGAELWRGRLPAAAHATPITFVSARTGRQFVVVAAGGHRGMGPHVSDAIVAFALPEQALAAQPAAR
jgi:membrane-bound PQQ-dependent dehydrogenase (glucose/quinate/shikimate family)